MTNISVIVEINSTSSIQYVNSSVPPQCAIISLFSFALRKWLTSNNILPSCVVDDTFDTTVCTCEASECAACVKY